MRVPEAKKIIKTKIKELIKIEPEWSVCECCPKNGQCCEGAPISIWPEEWSSIKILLDENDWLKKYVKQRFTNNKQCYFYDNKATQCLIHKVRPLNCIWTPYTIFYANELKGYLKNYNCEFKPLEKNRRIYPIKANDCIFKLDLRNIEKDKYHLHYILFQSIKEIEGLQARNMEFLPISHYLVNYFH